MQYGLFLGLCDEKWNRKKMGMMERIKIDLVGNR